jgi:cell division protein FtsW (lipid II flippase)
VELVTGPALGTLVVLAGLLWGVGGACRWMLRPVVVRGRGLRDWPALAVTVPQILIGLPFLIAGAPYALWVPAVVAAVVGLGRSGLRLGGRLSADGRVRTVAGPVLAVLAVSTLLLELGALLVVRLAVAPDPRGTFTSGFAPEALGRAWSALGQPALAIAVVLGLIVWLGRTTRSVGVRARRGVGWAARTDSLEQIHSASLTVALAGVVVLPFVLPLFFGSGSAALTAGPVATPEYGKLLLLGALAFVVARDSFRFRAVSVLDTWRDIRAGAGGLWRWPALRALYRAGRFLGLPLALFALVAVASGLRHDFGTIVPAALMTTAVTWAATRRNVEQDRGGESGRAGLAIRMLSAYRIFIALGVLFIVAGVSLFSTDYVGERGRVWNDPWAYRWDAACMVVDRPEESGLLIPDGQVPCRRSLAADVESERSQVARAIAATADGGLWGRGLRDTAAGAVTAGTTDFVLAVVWNKLGGLVVIAVGLLVVLLGAGLVRANAPPPGYERPPVAMLFGAGLGAMIVGQFLFVLAATANLVPHTGIPAPLLSRGGQSTLTVVLGIILTLLVARASAGPAAGYATAWPGRPARPGEAATPGGPAWRGEAAGAGGKAWPGGTARPDATANPGGPQRKGATARQPEMAGGPPRTATSIAAVGTVLAIVAGLTALPYSAPRLGSLRPPTVYDPHRPTCSARTADRAGLTSPAPDPAACSTDLIARLRTRVDLRFGDRPGFVLDRAGDGWTPAPGSEAAGLTPADLTGLIRIGDGPPGVVERSYPAVVSGTAGPSVRDRFLPAPRGGRTDGEVRLTLDPRLQRAAAEALRSGAPAGVVVLDASTGDVLVSASTPVPAGSGPPAAPDPAAVRRFAARHDHYVRPLPDGRLADDRPDPWCPRRSRDGFGQQACWRWSHTARPKPAADPDALVNRGVGRRYGLGSAFDVVVAAAYLDSDAAGDPPPVGDCSGTTVPEALAASCHDTFVALMDRLGWPVVAAQAQRLGLRAGDCPTTDPWPTGRLVGIASSCVPGDEKNGEEEPGGGEAGIAGTPLALAVVMAAVANGGRAVHPRLISSVTDPATGRTTTVAPAPPEPALTAGTSRDLRRALTDGSTGRSGDRTTWASGFLDTPRGPLGYAVVVEAAAAERGDGRARELARAISSAIGETR